MAELWGVRNIIVGTIKTSHPKGGKMIATLKCYEWTDSVSEVDNKNKVKTTRKIYAPISGIQPTFEDGVPFLDVT